MEKTSPVQEVHMKPVLLLTTVLLFVGNAVAQAPQATITGRITDASKAVVPAAKVTATNVGTAIGYYRQTDDTGTYTIPLLPPGDYRVEVEKTGFKTFVKPSVTLHIQDTVVLNFELAVGSVSENITVAGEAPPLDTTTSALTSLVTSREMRDLPLNGRNFSQLALLSPGVMPVALPPAPLDFSVWARH
jgi:hypothetical protein